MEEINKVVWMIVNLYDGNPQIHTLANLRKESIKLFLSDTDMDWKEVKGYGWKVIKVNLNLSPVQ